MKKDKLKISPGNIKAAGISICVVFTLILGTLATFNCSVYFKNKTRANQKKSQLLALENESKDLQETLKRYKEERKRLQELLFSETAIAGFLDKIAEFANSAKVNVIEMRAQRFQDVQIPKEIMDILSPMEKSAAEKEKGQEGVSLSNLPINMVINGEFDSIVNFLLSLENYRQILTITNVSIKRKVYPLLECKFTLRLYSLRELGKATMR